MEEHDCKQTDQIQLMWKMIDKLNTTINGNGVPGMKSTLACIQNDVSHIKDKQDEQSDEIKALSSGIRALIVANEESKGIEKGIEKQKKYNFNNWQKFGIIVTGIAGGSGIIIKIIDLIEKLSKLA